MSRRDYVDISVFIGVVAAAALMIGNWKFTGRWLDLSTLLAILLVVSLYFFCFYAVARALLTGRWFWMISSGLVLTVLLFTLTSVIYWLIYDLYPRWNVLLYKPGMPFSQQRFESRIWTSGLMVFVMAVGMALWHQMRWRRREGLRAYQAMLRDLEQLRKQLDYAHVYPHFVESVFSAAIGRSFMAQTGDRKALLCLAGVMRYLLDKHKDPKETVSLAEELEQVRALAEVINWKYGKGTVRSEFKTEQLNADHLSVPPAVMVTMLENCLKHGNLRVPKPAILLRLTDHDHGFRFSCSNRILPVVPPPVPEQLLSGDVLKHKRGFGLDYLRERLAASALSFDLKIESAKNWYQVTLIQDLQDEERKIYSGHCG